MSSPARTTALAAVAAFAALALALIPLGARAGAPSQPVAPGAPGAPRHDDLAAPWAWKLPKERVPIPVVPLPAAAGREILATAPLTEESPWQLRYSIPEDPKARAREERSRIAAEGKTVHREGSSLVVRPRSGPPLLFRNRTLPAAKDRDGDRTTFVYGGRIGTGSLYRIETSFEHDAPGSYLVSPSDGRSLFVHEGSDLVALSPDGSRIVAFNALNDPLTLVIASLAADGPSVELVCRAEGKLGVGLKGWHGAEAFDLVIQTGGGAKAQGAAARLERTTSGWRVATPDPKQLTGAFGCLAAPFPQPLR